MDGTVGLSLQLTGVSSTLSGRLKLQEGEILSLRVDESVGKNRYVITIRGVRLTVRSNIPLPAGSTMHAKVVFSGRRIELKILEPAAAVSTTLRPQGPEAVPASPPVAHDAATVLIQAMQRTGLPVTISSMNAITAMLPPKRRDNPAYVRLATILFDKHLRVDSNRLEELYLTINGRSDGDTGGGGSRHGTGGGPGDRSPQRGAGGAPSTEPAAEDEASTAQGAPASAVDSDLGSRLRRQLSAQGMDAIDWPALINHPIGEHESWVIVPFSLLSDTTSVDGTIRLLIAPPASRRVAAGTRLTVLRAVIVVPDVGAFEISGAPPRRLAVYPDSAGMRQRIAAFLPELREKLRNLGVEIDDTNNGGAVFDGFSAETFEIRGVNATA